MLGVVGCATTESSFDFEEYYADIDAYELSEVDQEPEIINGRNVMAQYMNYPEEARRNGVEGRVVVGLVVDKDGNPHNFRIIESLGYGLDIMVLNTLANSTFKPAMKDGEPVNVKYTTHMEFNLQRSEK
jgi:TonB family protein